MTALADNTRTTLLSLSANKHVPYSCWLRVDPIPGKRFERIRDLEYVANSVESILDAIVCEAGTEDLSFDVTKPIAFTRQFGNKPARLSFSGHLCALIPPDIFTKLPVGEQTVVNAGEIKTGPSINRSGRTTTSQLNTLVLNFKNLIETNTNLTVIRLEVARVIYGLGGFHFPK